MVLAFLAVSIVGFALRAHLLKLLKNELTEKWLQNYFDDLDLKDLTDFIQEKVGADAETQPLSGSMTCFSSNVVECQTMGSRTGANIIPITVVVLPTKIQGHAQCQNLAATRKSE